jgi:hypothetical protein
MDCEDNTLQRQYTAKTMHCNDNPLHLRRLQRASVVAILGSGLGAVRGLSYGRNGIREEQSSELPVSD